MSDPPATELHHLRAHGPHIWFAEASPETDAAIGERRRWLSSDERDRLGRYVSDQDRRLYLVSHLLVRAALSHYAPVPQQDWSFILRADGKPVIGGPTGAPPLTFNLSHSRELAVCAVAAAREVGVDVEDATREVDAAALAPRYFSAREAADVLARSGADRNQRFLEYWTAKEAVLKARGAGIVNGLSDVAVELGADGAARLLTPGGGPDPRWRVYRRTLAGRYLLAVAIEGGDAESAPLVRRWEPED